MVRDLNEFGIVVVNCSDKAESADHLTFGICLDLQGGPADGTCYLYILYIYIHIHYIQRMHHRLYLLLWGSALLDTSSWGGNFPFIDCL